MTGVGFTRKYYLSLSTSTFYHSTKATDNLQFISYLLTNIIIRDLNASGSFQLGENDNFFFFLLFLNLIIHTKMKMMLSFTYPCHLKCICFVDHKKCVFKKMFQSLFFPSLQCSLDPTPTFFSTSYFMFHSRKKVIQAWGWVNYGKCIIFGCAIPWMRISEI